MKKLAVLIILALAACVAYVAIAGEGAGAQQPPLIDHYKCYQARHAKRSPRFQSTTVFLTDQFRDNVDVNVIKLNTHCSSANQNSAGNAAGEFDNGLDCYTVRDAPRQDRFQPQNVDVRDKLTDWHLQTLTVSKVQSLCVRSEKGGFQGTLEGDGFVCYQAKTAKGQPRFQQTDRHITDQFGNKDVRILRPVAYCAQSEKKVDAPNDDFVNKDQFHDLPNTGVCADTAQYFCDIHLSTVHSTLESNDPVVTCKTDYTNSVWFDWNSTDNFSLILDTQGSSYDTVLAVFTGDKSTLAQHEVGCNDDVNLCDPVVQQIKDLTSNGCGGCAGGAESAAGCLCPVGSDGAAGCCASGSAESAAGCGCPEPITTTGAAGSPCTLPSSFLQFEAWANTTYHILVGSSDGHGGKLKFHIRAKDVIGNADSCSTPSGISSLTFIGQERFIHLSTMNATLNQAGVSVAGGVCDQQGDPDLNCTGDYGASVWFTYTPQNHQIVNWDSSGSSYPTAIAIFDEGTGGTQIECGASGSTQAEMKAGRKYRILVVSTDEDNSFQGGKLKLFLDLKDQLVVDGESAGVVQQGTPDSLTCYQVRQARHRTETDDVTDQFSIRQIDDPWTLTMGAVDTLCVPSNKNNCTRYTLSGASDGEDASLCFD